MGRMSSGFFGDEAEITLGFPSCDLVEGEGLGDLPLTPVVLIDKLASILIRLLIVGERAIIPKLILTVLTHLDAEDLAAVVVAHGYIIGQGAQDLNRNLKKSGERWVVGAIALLSLSIHYYRPGASINLEKPPENIALLGLLRTGSAPRCIHQLL